MQREPLTVGSLFTGIGGIDLGLERTGGFVTRWQCELDPYCNAVLEKHWPGVTRYGDIRTIDGTAERVDVIAGGFPCQPVSVAGRGLAQQDPRWLWPEFARVVGLLRPSYVIVENVPGLTNRGLGLVLGDLSTLGYDAEWQVVSAASVGAPHLRERLFVVSYPKVADTDSPGSQGYGGSVEGFSEWSSSASGLLAEQGDGASEELAYSNSTPRNGPWGTGEAIYRPETVERSRRRGSTPRGQWAVEPGVGRVANGVPSRLHRLKSLGNSVVPQVAEFVGNLILEAEGSV